MFGGGVGVGLAGTVVLVAAGATTRTGSRGAESRFSPPVAACIFA